jgi:hypothetical protein
VSPSYVVNPGCLVHAGMHAEVINQAGNGKNPQHLLPWRGQQQVAPGLPGVPARIRQRCYATGVDELQARQVDDDRRPADRDSRERSRDGRGVYHVKLPAQCDDDRAVAFTGTQVRTVHGRASLLQAAGRTCALTGAPAGGSCRGRCDCSHW